MYEAISGWFSFWTTYWLVHNMLPYDIRSKLIIPSQNVVLVVARNMLLSLPFSIVLWTIAPNISSWIPNSLIIRFMISCIIMDGWFYLIHRLLHTSQFYWLHKQHHQFHIPYPLMTVYCSPFEALFCDVMATGLGPALFKMSTPEIEIWMILMAIHSLLLHSSLSHGRDHNLHHRQNIRNFGLLSIFDIIFGTYL